MGPRRCPGSWGIQVNGCRIALPCTSTLLIGSGSAGTKLKEKGIGYPACRAPNSNARRWGIGRWIFQERTYLIDGAKAGLMYRDP